MRKKLFIIFLTIVFIISAAIIYLNKSILPIKIKSLIVQKLEKEIQKEITLESLQFNIFKGIVLRDLVIYDRAKQIISLKEGSCTFLVLPIFRKQIIIPTVRLKSPVLFLERKPDNTLNLLELLPKTGAKERGRKLNLLIYKVSITGARIDFQDNALPDPFNKTVDNLDLAMSLSLPASVKFNLTSEIPANPRIKINASGEFRIPEKKLTAKITIKDFSLQEFSNYYQNFQLYHPKGIIDALINLDLKDGILQADLESQNRGINLSKGDTLIKLNSSIEANLKYNLKNKQLISYSGNANIAKLDISGLKFVDRVVDISGEVEFNNSGLTSDKLSAKVLGMALEAKGNLTDFNNPLLNINIESALDLNSIQKILKDKFKFSFPAAVKGEGKLSLTIQTKLPAAETPKISGYLDIHNAIVKLEKIDAPFEDIAGQFKFTGNTLNWPELNFKFRGIPYKAEGRLTNFQSPKIQMELSSNDLFLQSNFVLNNRSINISGLSGKWFNSEFSLQGNIDMKKPPRLQAEISAGLNVDLSDINEPLTKLKKQWEQIKLAGIMQAKVKVDGNINNIKSCIIQAGLSSPSLSAYGLKSKGFLLNYTQADGLAQVPFMQLSLYGGTIEANVKMNLNYKELPFWVKADIKNVKIEKLKLDTAAKEKDISGTIQAQAKINGLVNNLSKLEGEGSILISEGKLWQLNVFKGLGELLFKKNFANIVFREGYCEFVIQNKYIFTDNLTLKSNLANLTGPVKIGFDGSINSSLEAQVQEEETSEKDIFKTIATAIIGEAGRFGVIKISGTLKNPMYKFEAKVVDLIKGITDSLLGKPSQ